MKNFYETLGVEQDASAEEIKKVYRNLAIQFHPDKNPDDAEAEARFKELGEAYDTLSDSKKRQKYDTFLARGGRGAPDDYQDWGSAGPGMSMEDILARFGDMFGSDYGSPFQRRQPAARPGRDIETELSVDFRTAALGGKIAVNIKGDVACTDCEGRGAVGEPVPCSTCGGAGRVTQNMDPRGQFFSASRACPQCRGSGQKPGAACPSCSGSGTTNRTRQVDITIPEGVKDGATLRLRGLGGAGTAGAPPGNLRVVIRVKPDPLFRREQDDVHSDLKVPVAIAALGGKASLNTIHGEVVVTVAPGTSSGEQLRLKGQGIRNGAHIARVMIQVPKTLTDREREIFEELGSPSET